MGKCIRCGKFKLFGLNEDHLCPDCAALTQKEKEEQERLEKERLEKEAKEKLAQSMLLPERTWGFTLSYSYEDVEIEIPDASLFDTLAPGTNLYGFIHSDNKDDPQSVSLNYYGIIRAFLCPGKLKDMAYDFISRREKVVAVVLGPSQSNHRAIVRLGFYRSPRLVPNSRISQYTLSKPFKLVSNTNADMQEAIDFCALRDGCDLSYDYEKEKYLVQSGCEIGYLPASGTKFLESLDEDADCIAFIDEIGENDNEKLYVTIRIGVK